MVKYEISLTAQNCFGKHALQKTVVVQERPQLELDSEGFEVHLVAGENATKTLNLSNVGAGEMYFGVQTAAFEEDTVIEKTYTDLGGGCLHLRKPKSIDRISFGGAHQWRF